MRGPGETQIETDRRLILERIALLKQKLKEIDMQKTVQRKNRGKLVRVALVGYTNVGKSTIMNLLSKSEVYVPFSSCIQSFPASGSFQMSQLLASGGQSIGISASTSVLPMNIQN